jgi:hypothetical protein
MIVLSSSHSPFIVKIVFSFAAIFEFFELLLCCLSLFLSEHRLDPSHGPDLFDLFRTLRFFHCLFGDVDIETSEELRLKTIGRWF